jgi:hypothetical protein
MVVFALVECVGFRNILDVVRRVGAKESIMKKMNDKHHEVITDLKPRKPSSGILSW